MKKITYIILFFLACLTVPYAMEEQVSILSKPEEHTRFLRESLVTAQQRVIIVSPFITRWRLEDTSFNGNDGLGKPIRAAVERGIEITVFTDEKFDAAKEPARIGRELLARLGVDLKIVSRLHSKNLIIDNRCITFGSFNWLSAETDPTKPNCNYETTTILRHERAEEAIAKIIPELIKLEVKLCGGAYSSSLLDLSISEDDQVAYALELYQEHNTRPHYKQLAEHILCQYMLYCFDAKAGLRILRMAVSAGGANNLIITGTGVLPRYCTRACEFVELAEMLVGINQLPKAIEVAANILHINRGEEFEELGSICDRLSRIGLGEMGNKFEQYILGTHSQ